MEEAFSLRYNSHKQGRGNANHPNTFVINPVAIKACANSIETVDEAPTLQASNWLNSTNAYHLKGGKGFAILEPAGVIDTMQSAREGSPRLYESDACSLLSPSTGGAKLKVVYKAANGDRLYSENAPTLRSLSSTNGHQGGSGAMKVREINGELYHERPMTAAEYENCMGWESGCTTTGITTDGKEFQVSETQRKKVLGNGIIPQEVTELLAALRPFLEAEPEPTEYQWGADGVGRGNCAGLNVWAVCGIPKGIVIDGVKDSKKTNRQQRVNLAAKIHESCVVGLGVATPAEIDELGINAAEKLALSRAIAHVRAQGYEPTDVIGDLAIPAIEGASTKREKSADDKYPEASAASIAAKYALDLYWERVNDQYPGYGFLAHAGYVQPSHLGAIGKFGLIPGIYRLSYKPCREKTAVVAAAESLNTQAGYTMVATFSGFDDFSSFPSDESMQAKSEKARLIRDQILAVDSEADYAELRNNPNLTREQLNWVRENLISKEERKALAQRIKSNPLPKLETGSLSADKLKAVAQERGLLPKKQSTPIVAAAQSVGLSGKELQQLPDVPPNADIPPEPLAPSLLNCLSLLEVNDFIRAKRSEAIAEFVSVGWQERFDLRVLTQNTVDSVLMVDATESQIRQVIPLLDRDKDSKIAWLENRVKELEALLTSKGSKHKQKDKNTTVEWYTPDEPYVQLVRQTFGGQIDTDPASNDFAQTWIKADQYFTKETDGLANSHLWKGFVFCNPPYGNEPRKWLAETIRLYQLGQIDGAIFLINRSGSRWFRNIKKDLSAVCQVHDRIKFINQFGEVAGSPMYDNDFLCIGESIVDAFAELFSGIGDVTVLRASAQEAA